MNIRPKLRIIALASLMLVPMPAQAGFGDWFGSWFGGFSQKTTALVAGGAVFILGGAWLLYQYTRRPRQTIFGPIHPTPQTRETNNLAYGLLNIIEANTTEENIEENNNDDTAITEQLQQAAIIEQLRQKAITEQLLRIQINDDNISDSLENGDTALHIAAAHCLTEVMAFLREQGADIEARNHAGDTPLITAFDNKHGNAVKLLIQQGANICAQNNLGQTMLIKVLGNTNITSDGILGQIESIMTNVLRRCDNATKQQLLDAQDNNGNTALLCILDKHINDNDLFRTFALNLIRHGADITIANDDDQSPRSLAEDQESNIDSEIRRMILDKHNGKDMWQQGYTV